MIKKFLKALLMGIWMSDVIRWIIVTYLYVGWLPAVVALVLKVFNITLSIEYGFAVFMVSAFFGFILAIYISRCIKAVKYSEKHKCSLTKAWRRTF